MGKKICHGNKNICTLYKKNIIISNAMTLIYLNAKAKKIFVHSAKISEQLKSGASIHFYSFLDFLQCDISSSNFIMFFCFLVH